MSRIDKDDAPSLVVIRFQNLMGALVLVYATELGHRANFWWHCQGCLAGGEVHGLDGNRIKANDHAATCRALPQPERPAA